MFAKRTFTSAMGLGGSDVSSSSKVARSGAAVSVNGLLAGSVSFDSTQLAGVGASLSAQSLPFARSGGSAVNSGLSTNDMQTMGPFITPIVAAELPDGSEATISNGMPLFTLRTEDSQGFEHTRSTASMNAALALASGARRAGATQPRLAALVAEQYAPFAPLITAADVARAFAFSGVAQRLGEASYTHEGDMRMLSVAFGKDVTVKNIFGTVCAGDFVYLQVSGHEITPESTYVNAFGTVVAARTPGEPEIVPCITGGIGSQRNAPIRNSARAIADVSHTVTTPSAKKGDLDYMSTRTLPVSKARSITLDADGNRVAGPVVSTLPPLAYSAYTLGYAWPVGIVRRTPDVQPTAGEIEAARYSTGALASLPDVEVWMRVS